METLFVRVIEWIPLWFKIYLMLAAGIPLLLVTLEQFLWDGFAIDVFESCMDALILSIFAVTYPFWVRAQSRWHAAWEIMRAGKYTPGCV